MKRTIKMMIKNTIPNTFFFFLLFVLATNFQSNAQIPVDELEPGGGGMILIDEPGHYFLRDTLWITTPENGIVINSDNVTLDLNGFAIIAGPQFTSDGIEIDGRHNNITIKNGTVSGFASDGIEAINTDESTFQNLLVENNGGDGLWVNYSCQIVNCIARGNGSEGFSMDDGSIMRNCVASQNGSDGIKTSQSCIIDHCTSFNNGGDGISISSGSRIEGCTVYDNTRHGLDISFACICINNVAYRNGWNGIDASSNSALIMNNVSNDNGSCITNGTCGTGPGGQGDIKDQGAGIKTQANVRVIGNQCSGNYYGIVANSSDGSYINNSTQHNRHAGIIGTASGSLYLKNTAEGNGFAQSPSVTDPVTYPLGNIVFRSSNPVGSAMGPIIDVSNAGDISTITGANHPFANFIY